MQTLSFLCQAWKNTENIFYCFKWYSPQFVHTFTVVLILYASDQLGLKVLLEWLFCFSVTMRFYTSPESQFTIFVAAYYLACVASVSLGRGSGAKNCHVKKERGGGGEGRKCLQTNPWILKTAHFVFHAFRTNFMLSSSIQVAFVILVLAGFEILDHCIFLSNKNDTRLP